MEMAKEKTNIADRIKEHENVILKFYAEWCGPCKALNQIMERLEGKYKNIEFISVNTDHHQDVAAQYKVESLPTLVYLKRKEDSDKHETVSVLNNGATKQYEIEKAIKEYF